MKETIYTIPINDAYDIKCGCPVCKLSKDLESASVEYIMGAAMMEPDVRTETNLRGFCDTHFKQMLEHQKKLSLALILESHLNELISVCFESSTDKLSKKEAERISSRLKVTADECFVCARIEERMEKYYRNILYLWRYEPDFREKTRSQEYFCPKHLSAILEHGQKILDKKLLPEFYSDHLSATAKHLGALKEDISKFCKSFDHRFADMPLGEARHAVESAISYLTNQNFK